MDIQGDNFQNPSNEGNANTTPNQQPTQQQATSDSDTDMDNENGTITSGPKDININLTSWQPFLETDTAASLIADGTIEDFHPSVDLHAANIFEIAKADAPGTYTPDFSWDRIHHLSHKYRFSPHPLDFKHHVKQIRKIAGKNDHIDTTIQKFTTELTQNLSVPQKHDTKFIEHQQQRIFLQQQLISKLHHLTTALQFLPDNLSPAEQQKTTQHIFTNIQHTLQANILLHNIQLAELEFKKRDIILRSHRAPVPTRIPVEDQQRTDIDSVLKQHIKQTKKLRLFLKPKNRIPPTLQTKRPSVTPPHTSSYNQTRQNHNITYNNRPPPSNSTPNAPLGKRQNNI
jgi:hypothetical protein